jgi:AcrR family transcriptional regulator
LAKLEMTSAIEAPPAGSGIGKLELTDESPSVVVSGKVSCMPARRARRLGRPPASDSADTKQRILDVARCAFGELGWEKTTNKDIAAKAGITSGALYHYFDSKLDMYWAVYDHVLDTVEARFLEAISRSDTFVGQFIAILEAAHEMNAADPSLARFVGSSRVDIARHDDLRRHLGRRRSAGIVSRLADQAVATGEVDSSRRQELVAFVTTVLAGLTDAMSDDLNAHRVAIDSIRAALGGELIRPPRPRRGRPRRDAEAETAALPSGSKRVPPAPSTDETSPMAGKRSAASRAGRQPAAETPAS